MRCRIALPYRLPMGKDSTGEPLPGSRHAPRLASDPPDDGFGDDFDDAGQDTTVLPADGDTESEATTEERRRVRRPRRFKVILHNDDFTTMDFVVAVLRQFFGKSPAEAVHVMLQVHHKGQGVAGVYTRDVAETKVAEVTAAARAEGMPLLLTTEPE